MLMILFRKKKVDDETCSTDTKPDSDSKRSNNDRLHDVFFAAGEVAEGLSNTELDSGSDIVLFGDMAPSCFKEH